MVPCGAAELCTSGPCRQRKQAGSNLKKKSQELRILSCRKKMPQLRKGSSSFGDNKEFSDVTLACEDGQFLLCQSITDTRQINTKYKAGQSAQRWKNAHTKHNEHCNICSNTVSGLKANNFQMLFIFATTGFVFPLIRQKRTIWVQ